MDSIKICLRSKRVGMNKSIILKSIKICFKVCPSDSVILILISVFLSVLPAFILYSYNSLIANINIFHVSILIIFGYCLLNFIQKSFYNFYNHYYLNYRTLLKFEKHMKLNFFEVCSQLNLEDYFLPEIVNETRRAQNASINIFRVYQIIVEIVSSVIGILLIGSIVFSIHPTLILFLVLAIISPVADNIYQVVQKKYLLYTNTQKQKEEEEYVKFLTKPEHIKEIKVLNCFKFIFNKWEKSREIIVKIEQRSQLKILIVSIFFNLIRITGTVGAYWSITSLYITQQINLAEFSMTILTFSQITQLFNQLFSLFGNLSEFAIMVKPYFVFLEKTANRSQDKKKIIEKNLGQTIVVNNISYQYPGADSWALKNINLTIKKGDFISIVGENGSGKTTLSKILLGLLIPTKGYLEVDNFTTKEALLNDISYIPQIFNCYCVSIMDNILFGRSEESKTIDQALDDIGLSGLKNQKENLYGLAFGGIELSGGQKQRIAILRAMFKESNLFIFDEPTSAIDPIQESLIYHSLLRASNGKTAILVSHRLALTRQSDLIVVLKNGTIVERGNHDTLIKENGEYARMWKAQADLYNS